MKHIIGRVIYNIQDKQLNIEHLNND